MIRAITTVLILTALAFSDVSVLKTGQTQSYDMDGNVVTDGSVKDDGFYQMGKDRNYSRSALGVVTDHATGIEWQDDVASVLKSWVTQANYEAGNYDDTNGDTAATYCSELGLDSGGWRLPRMEELETLIDNGEENPSITANMFENLSPYDYWSSTTSVVDTKYAWVVGFKEGDSLRGLKYEPYPYRKRYVRCVRGGQLEPSNLSRDDTKEIVTDSTSGLQWQDNETVPTITRIWIDTINYCEDLDWSGYNDWRVPNIKELLSILDRSRENPAISNAFDNVSGFGYWSSTAFTYKSREDRSWVLNFSLGDSYDSDKPASLSVRCVRGGQAETSTFNPSIIMYLLN